MAIQLWQQILLSAPNNSDALAGLVKDYKLVGSPDLANQALDRLRKINPRDPAVLSALRQDLASNSANAKPAPQIHQSLPSHPVDTKPAANLSQNQKTPAVIHSAITRNPAESAAFAALNAHKLDEADKLFSDLLESEPANGRTLAGMGYLRMQQKNFADAINYLSLAEQHSYKSKSVDDALATSRFYLVLAEATEAFNANHLDVAQTRFRAALDMNPRNPDALNGLAGVYLQQKQYLVAAGIYEELVKLDPASASAWRGLFLSYARSDQNDKALAVTTRLPSAVIAALNKDADYLRTLAAIYQSQHRDADAQRVLSLALALPFPGNGSTIEAGTRMQYAGILMEAHRYPQAVALYTQLLAADPANLSTWMGLIAAQHELGQDAQAVADVEKMPPPTYESALKDPSFLSLLGAVYQQVNQYDVAQGMIERAEKLIAASGSQPPVSLDLQLASIYLLRNAPDRAEEIDQAYEIYRRLVSAHPDNADAWKGLVASLAAADRNAESLQEIDRIPTAVRRRLDSDIAFIETEAAVYTAAGDTARAAQCMNRVLAYYAKLRQPPPPAIDIQNAWMLYDDGNDRALYSALMRIGGRSDLTVAQRQSVENIWANWSVRRAAAAIANGDTVHAVDILDAASLAFPNNLDVRKAVAAGYAQVGRAKDALALYKSIPMQDASPRDFEGAVGAALAANDKSQAESWLHLALDRFPRDPAVLALAAHYEQARGNYERAAEYYRESLAAMPPASSTDRLAHTLADPDQDSRAHHAVAAADLQRLLDPENEPLPKTARIPPPPPYGLNPFQDLAPVATPEPQLPAQPTPPSSQPHPNVNFVPQSFHSSQPLSEKGAARHTEKRVPHPRHALVFVARVGSGGPSPRCAAHRTVLQSEPSAAQRVEGPVFALINEKLPIHYFNQRTPTHPSAHRVILVSLRPTRVLRHVLQSSSVPETPALQSDAPDIILNPSHSLASDSWKGLVFSLIASDRNAEALMQLSKIPPGIRRQLESDIEWVQGVASLYVAVGDTPHSDVYLGRVANFYLLHRAPLPIAVEIQHAWLLSNAHNDSALYPVMQHLDVRGDMNPADREQIDSLWISMALRRAAADLDSGRLQHGIEILHAAAEDYPDSMLIRRALAAAYLRVGRAQDALAIYKTIPMDSATPGDFEGAIGAALAAGDLAQTESWLHVALARYADDPQILALAARFEQTRGNSQRAGEFWRAALAAMPPGSNAKRPDAYSLNSAPTSSTSVNPSPARGEIRRLLDPRLNSSSSPDQIAPLPSYKSNLSTSPQSFTYPSVNLSQHTLPSNHPLPLPSAPEQGSNLGIDQGGADSHAAIEQNATLSAAATLTASYAAPNVFTGIADSSSANPAAWEVPETYTPDTSVPLAPAPQINLPVDAQPMYRRYTPPASAHTPELTQAPAANAQSIPTAPVTQMPAAPYAPRIEFASNSAQSASSIQEAITGAFSAPQSSSASSASASPSSAAHGLSSPTKSAPGAAVAPHPLTHRKPAPQPSIAKPAAQSSAEASAQTTPPWQTLGDAPSAADATFESSAQTGPGNDELAQGDLSPLRGPWTRIFRAANPPSPREQIEEQLRAIEGGYSGWLGGTSTVNYRSGTPGYDQLAAIETPFEAATPLGVNARLVAVAKPVYLDSGAASAGSATISVLESTGSENSLFTIPEPIGTLTTTSTTPPAQQNAVGIGGELELIFPHLAIAGGYTPSNFLVSTFTSRFQWRPANGPLTISVLRDSVKDSQLSYAGLRDPADNTLTSHGQIWGGVVANQAQVQFAHSATQSGFYLTAGGQYLTGHNALSNTRVDGNAGAYWHVLTLPEHGDLTIGANFFGLHYANNQNAFTFGMGGYFSPQTYILANVPFNWVGHWQTRWHYTVDGALGVQAFEQNSTLLWPLAAQKALETSQGNPMLPNLTSVGANYDLKSVVAYQVSPHLFAGFDVGANNTRNYNFSSVGFFLRFTFRQQPSAVAAPTGLFPTDGLRPFTVP